MTSGDERLRCGTKQRSGCNKDKDWKQFSFWGNMWVSYGKAANYFSSPLVSGLLCKSDPWAEESDSFKF